MNISGCQGKILSVFRFRERSSNPFVEAEPGCKARTPSPGVAATKYCVRMGLSGTLQHCLFGKDVCMRGRAWYPPGLILILCFCSLVATAQSTRRSRPAALPQPHTGTVTITYTPGHPLHTFVPS